MIDQKLTDEAKATIEKLALEILEEESNNGYDLSHLANEETTGKAIKSAIIFHGQMQLFNPKEGVEDEELEKTLRHLLNNKDEFKVYLKGKLLLA